MNERIRKLAEQAEWRFADKATGNFSEYDQRLEKFAKLIIQECIIAVAPELNSEFDVFVINGLTHKIKKHFGVEE